MKAASPRMGALGLVPAAALAILAPFPARAEEIRCKANYDYSVEVDGSYPKDATLYQSTAPGKYYIDVPACKAGLLMDMKEKKVVAVPRDLVRQVDGVLQLPEAPPPAAATFALSVEGPIVQFQAENKKVRIMRCFDRPPIIGQVDMSALAADRPEYREGMKAYTPDPTSIAALNKYAKKVQIDAFFATWCPHCKEYMPRLLRALSEVKNPNIKLNLYGVPKGFTQAQGPWQGRSITSIPTIIVKIDGREITRLGSQPGAVPEMELAGIFQAVR